MQENSSLGRHSETHAKLVMKLFEAARFFLLTEKKSYTDAWIAALNGCIAYICNYSQLSLLRTP